MPVEPPDKRTFIFFDGQNLFYSVKQAFGYSYPNYDPHLGQEKGVDVRLALDVVRLARENQYDVAVIFSQDQDLSEVATEVRSIARDQDRWIKLACAYPISPTTTNTRGISGTDWIHIDRAAYDACLDPNDYRPKQPAPSGGETT